MYKPDKIPVFTKLSEVESPVFRKYPWLVEEVCRTPEDAWKAGERWYEEGVRGDRFGFIGFVLGAVKVRDGYQCAVVAFHSDT